MLIAAAALAFAGDARAQSDYPSRPIRFIVGFAAGGGNDIFARLVLNKLQELTGWTTVVENKPGAGGRIASEFVAHQIADGYIVLIGATGQMSIAAAIYPKLAYHPTKSFIPLNMIASFPLILVVPENHPAKSVKDMIEWAKANPDKSNYGTSSPAFTIASETLKLKTGMPAVAIPFKGTNESNLCVISDQCLFTISDPPPAIPLIKGGKLRALAVTGATRNPTLPDVPTIAESGLPGYESALWQAIVAPAGTPAAIVAKVGADVKEVVAAPDVKEKLIAQGAVPQASTPAELQKLIDADLARYGRIIKEKGLKAE